MGWRMGCRNFFWGDAAFWTAARDPAPGLDGDKSSDPAHPSISGVQMKRELNLLDLFMLGVASVIGAGAPPVASSRCRCCGWQVVA